MAAVAYPAPPIDQKKSWLDRGLSLVSDVHAGEGVTALLLATNVFALLAFYYVIKTVRDSLILSERSAEVASYSAAGQALLLLVLVPAYGAFASRVNRIRLVSSVTIFFASHLLIFYVLGVAGVHVGVPFYLWAGVFNLVVIAQFWAFANDLYSNERGKRLFPVVGLGASLGAVLGAKATAWAFAGVGPYRLMLIAASGLLASVALTWWANGRERAAGRDHAADRAEQPLDRKGGFQLVFTERYLLSIALMAVVLNLVNTLGEFMLNKLAVAEALRTVGAAGTGAFIGTFKGNFFAWVNLVGFLCQLLLVSRIFKYIGVGGALFILPLVALGSYSMFAFLPVLSVVRIGKIAENATDYSIQMTTRHALFLPTSREAKYKAKQAIDSFFWRAGDLLQAVVVFVGSQFAFNLRHYALLNVAFVAAWLAIVVAIYREHKKIVAVGAGAEAAA